MPSLAELIAFGIAIATSEPLATRTCRCRSTRSNCTRRVSLYSRVKRTLGCRVSRLSAVVAPWRGARRVLCGRYASPSERGIHASDCVSAHWVGTFSSCCVPSADEKRIAILGRVRWGVNLALGHAQHSSIHSKLNCCCVLLADATVWVEDFVGGGGVSFTACFSLGTCAVSFACGLKKA